VLGDLMRHAPLKELTRPGQRSCSHHDHGSVELVSRLDDAFPHRRRDASPRLCGEARPPRELSAGVGTRARVVEVHVLERACGRYRRNDGDALGRGQRRPDVKNDSAAIAKQHRGPADRAASCG
jgi:hypothetical protein